MKIYKEVVVIEVRGKPRENSDHENKKKQVFLEEGSVLLRGQVSSENIGDQCFSILISKAKEINTFRLLKATGSYYGVGN